MPQGKKQRSYTAEFKQQLVDLYNNGKSVLEISREYDIARSVVNRWVKCINATGSAKAKDNMTAEQIKLKQLQKENLQLKMENDILKQHSNFPMRQKAAPVYRNN